MLKLSNVVALHKDFLFLNFSLALFFRLSISLDVCTWLLNLLILEKQWGLGIIVIACEHVLVIRTVKYKQEKVLLYEVTRNIVLENFDRANQTLMELTKPGFKIIY